jgi:biopolymer transport protein ExbD
MQAAKPRGLQAAINVTPLVDVVLVLLIIFMVIAPRLRSGPEVDVPTTDRPPSRPDDGHQLLVALDQDGTIWVERESVAAGELAQHIQRAAGQRGDKRVVIQGDARLTFGEVERAMLAVEAAGFHDVSLVARRHDEAAAEE